MIVVCDVVHRCLNKNGGVALRNSRPQLIAVFTRAAILGRVRAEPKRLFFVLYIYFFDVSYSGYVKGEGPSEAPVYTSGKPSDLKIGKSLFDEMKWTADHDNSGGYRGRT